ncbi:hypothetical protein B7486_70240, partial [cyanobacterium TDX16]
MIENRSAIDERGPAMGGSSRAGIRAIGAVVAAMTVAVLGVGVGAAPASAATGDITTYVDPLDGISGAGAIVLGPDGNMWFTSRNTDRVG